MEPIKMASCACQQAEVKEEQVSGRIGGRHVALGAGVIAAFILIYRQLLPASEWLTYSVFGLTRGSHMGEAVAFFLYDTPKVLMLLAAAVYVIGIIRSFFTPERTRRILAGKNEAVGNCLAALLGIVTPFCSCSAVPLFIGFVTAGVPLGVTFSFLIAAPMVNEIAVILLYGLLGWKITLLYVLTGLSIAIVAGWVLGRLRLGGLIEEWVLEMQNSGELQIEQRMGWPERLQYGWDAVKDIVGKVWPYVLAGIAVGAGIHGYVPEGMMASIMGRDAWWSVPAAVLVGIPMYSSAAGIVPVIQALLGKGAALGTVLAFMMSVIALSLPEAVILRKVLKPKLIVIFISVVGSGILLVGYLFNLVI